MDLLDDIYVPGPPPPFNLDEFEATLDLDGPFGPVMVAALKRDVRALIAELRRYRAKKPRLSTITNGHAGFEVKCSSCGKTFMRAKRPVVGRRAYCADCRASGEPAAQRQRDYRARRSEE